MSNSIVGVRPTAQGAPLNSSIVAPLGTVPGSIAPGSLVRPSPGQFNSGYRAPTSGVLDVQQPPAPLPAPAPAGTRLGMPDPASIQAQKERFAKSLEDQLHQGGSLLNAQHKNKIDQLNAQANLHKRQYHLAVDQRVKQEELVLTEKYNDTLMMLQQAAQAKRTELEQQACAMMLEYQQKKTADEFANNESGINHKYHEEQAKLSGELHKLNSQMTRGSSFVSAPSQPVAAYASPPVAAYAPPPSMLPATPQATLPYMPPQPNAYIAGAYSSGSFVPNVRGAYSSGSYVPQATLPYMPPQPNVLGGSFVPNIVPHRGGGSFVPMPNTRGGSFVPNVMVQHHTAPMPARVFA